VPTIYTNNDKNQNNDHILVSSLRQSVANGTLSDRDVTEQLNNNEFRKNTGNISKNNM
jgi:hypothetical protein